MKRLAPMVLTLAAAAVWILAPGAGHADPTAYTYCSGNAKVSPSQLPVDPAHPPSNPAQIDPLSPVRKDCTSGVPGQPPNFKPAVNMDIIVTLEGTNFTGTVSAYIVPVAGPPIFGGGGKASGLFVNGTLLGPAPGAPDNPPAPLTAGVEYKIIATGHGIGVFIANISPAPTV